MNLHSYIAKNGFRVEAEPKEITLRVFDSGDIHIFNCQITAAGLDTARITAGAIMPDKQFDTRVHNAINEWLIKQGFESGIFERETKSIIKFKSIKRLLRL